MENNFLKLSQPTIHNKIPAFSDIFLSVVEQNQSKAEEKSSLKNRADMCRNSLFYMLQEFWPEISSDEPLWNWHIEYLARHLMELALLVSENKPKKHDLIINVSPGTTKSVLCSIVFPVWCWINWHWMKFITASYSAALSLDHAKKSRNLIRSPKFRELFPKLDIKPDQDTQSNFCIQKKINGKWEMGGNRYSTSVGGTLMGFHGHIQIVDDPLDPNRAASAVELKTTNDWMDQTLSLRKINKAVTPMVLVMQRLNQDDPTGHILNKERKNVFQICLPGEIQNFKDCVKPPELIEEYKDNLFDQIRMDWNVLHEIENTLGQYGYAGQIGQKPTPPGGGMFKVDHFQITDDPGKPKLIVRSWDKAGSAGRGCYTVGVKMGRLPDKRFIILDVKRGQWDSAVREKIIRETAIADGINVLIGIEQEPGSGGLESAQATIRNLAGFTVNAIRPAGNKIFRADPYSVQVNNGNVLLLRGEWNKPFIDEHTFFPFGTHKDQVDAAACAFKMAISKRSIKFIY